MSWRSRLSRALRRQAQRFQKTEDRPNCNAMVLRSLRTERVRYPRGVYPWKQSWLCAKMLLLRGFSDDHIRRHSRELRRSRA